MAPSSRCGWGHRTGPKQLLIRPYASGRDVLSCLGYPGSMRSASVRSKGKGMVIDPGEFGMPVALS